MKLPAIGDCFVRTYHPDFRSVYVVESVRGATDHSEIWLSLQSVTGGIEAERKTIRKRRLVFLKTLEGDLWKSCSPLEQLANEVE